MGGLGLDKKQKRTAGVAPAAIMYITFWDRFSCLASSSDMLIVGGVSERWDVLGGTMS